MIAWIKSVLRENISVEDIAIGMQVWESHYGRPYFQPQECPFSEAVKLKGVVTRQFSSTRHDN